MMDERHGTNGTNGQTNGTNGSVAEDVKERKRSLWQHVRHYWKYVSVEPVMVAWLVPSCIALIAVQNLELQKGCRVNFNYTANVCNAMIDKAKYGIDCELVGVKMANMTLATNGGNLTASNFPEYVVTDLERLACAAEIDSQTLDTQLNVYTAPMESTFAILMILFAAGWSDRRGLRKPCMLFPMIGELGAFIVYLIASIFFDTLPMQFNAVLGKLLPALFGKENLMLMGVFSYLTETTPEKDRTFRFGIFATSIQILPVVFVPFSGVLFEQLGYISLFLLCIIINLLGIVYLIFVLREPKKHPKKDVQVDGVDNPAFEKSKGEPIDGINTNGRETLQMDEPQRPVKSCLLDFFNPIVAVECVRLIVKKRPHNARRIVLLLLFLYLIVQASSGEDPNEYNFTRIKLGWGGEDYSPFISFSSFTAMIGTLVMVTGVAKIFGLADALVGFMSTCFSAVARLIFANAVSTLWMYAARLCDMFVSVRVLTLKSITSVVVESDEIGKVFSIMGILESLGRSFFVPVYAIIYERTLATWPSAFYVFSFVILVLAAILYLVVYVIVKQLVKNREEAAAVAAAHTAADKHDIQITHM